MWIIKSNIFQMTGYSFDVGDLSRPSTVTANSTEDHNNTGSSFGSVETGGGGSGPTRTNL